MTVKTNLANRRFTFWGKSPSCPEPAPFVEIVNLVTGISAVGEDRPNYKEIIKRGGSATNSYSKSESNYRRKSGELRVRMKNRTFCKNGVVGYSKAVGLYPSIMSAKSYTRVAAAADNEARLLFFRKARNEMVQFGGGQFLAEFHKTVSMLRHPAQALRRGLDVHMRQVRTRFGKLILKKGYTPPVLQAIGSSYLEWAFGVKPLIADISDIADASLAFMVNERKRISAKSTKSESTSTIGQNGVAGISAVVAWSEDLSTISECKWYGAISRELLNDKSPFERIIQLGGFDLAQFVPTAYELMPWSWLIDYFVNVGDILEANSVSLSSLAWSGTTVCNTTVRRRHSLKLTYLDTKNLDMLSFDPPRDYAYRKVITRSAASPSIPSLTMSMPGRDTQWINMLALLAAKSKI